MSAPTHTPGELDRLIETEQRLAGRLTEARRAAGRVIEEAREAAREAEHALEAELAASVDALRGRIESERDRRVAALARSARDAAAALDGMAPERLAALAAYVLDRLLAGGKPP
jgi:hypothetical protein